MVFPNEKCFADMKFLESPGLYENLIDGFCVYTYSRIPQVKKYKTVNIYPPKYLLASMQVIE